MLKKSSFEKINPEENNEEIFEPEHYGDSWNEDLDNADKLIIENYFKQFVRSMFCFNIFTNYLSNN